ncbi:hypothetical protein [Rhizobium johnstonii]|uniref:hypothetical protein n=1 Tax=Rhizobium johnstonii TaxID=3019933 RepID=UPI003F9AA8D5
MGEAKQKNAQMIATIRNEMERWTQPYTAEEAEMVTEIKRIPVQHIQRGPLDQLKWMRMRPRYCHDNAVWMEENDPEHEARAVSGWLVTPGTFVLHSVVRQRGALICVTPAETGHEDWIDFIPDPALMRSKTPAGQYIFQRGSHPISYGLRYDPEFVEGLWDLTRKNLDAGKSAQVIATESMRYMRENWMSP